jgi:hypothetical protein
MRALSLRQPWAWLMIRPDITVPAEREVARELHLIKDIENRDWHTKVRGRVLVHAAKTMTRDDYATAHAHASDLGIELPPANELDRGGIVGEFFITGCVTNHESPWFFGDFGFTVENAKPLPFTPCRGMLGFFEPEISEHLFRVEQEGEDPPIFRSELDLPPCSAPQAIALHHIKDASGSYTRFANGTWLPAGGDCLSKAARQHFAVTDRTILSLIRNGYLTVTQELNGKPVRVTLTFP